MKARNQLAFTTFYLSTRYFQNLERAHQISVRVTGYNLHSSPVFVSNAALQGVTAKYPFT